VTDGSFRNSVGQIYSALAYYWDHQAELEQDLERRTRQVDQIQREQKPTALDVRLNVAEKESR
jgi:hypothetical protein